ncbi:hypothetical protein [Rhodoferax antarcticus]|uniref:hypothetical protein n=1 Tax=Rhodoferax antarcticus TaxID=81479 RepID=UPI002224EB20|nr:hypothetical protein [Rhodoferax antarcticus]MCW2311468.1 hypothetical protein [Rhodoferax antarcticus]
MNDHINTLEGFVLPDSAQGCRARAAALQGEISSIRIQIATTDIRRQTEKKTLDPAWYHRAKTALRLKQQELALVTVHLASIADRPRATRRDGFKDALIEVVRAQCDETQWAGLLNHARAIHDSRESHHG